MNTTNISTCDDHVINIKKEKDHVVLHGILTTLAKNPSLTQLCGKTQTKHIVSALGVKSK